MTDPIADMLTRIRNASLVKQQSVLVPFSKTKYEIGKILKREGFILKSEKIDYADKSSKNKLPYLNIELKYKDGISVVQGIKRISKSGLRIYQGYRDIPKALPSLGILIVSTPKGLMSNLEAKHLKLGGEVICEIF